MNHLERFWKWLWSSPAKKQATDELHHNPLEGLHGMLVSLLENLPKQGEPFPTEQRDRFDKAWAAALDFIYPQKSTPQGQRK